MTKKMADYKITELIYRGKKRLVYRGKRIADGTPVILKSFAGDLPSEENLSRLKHEHEILKSLNINGVPETFGIEWQETRPALIIEDIGGQTLSSFIGPKASEQINVKRFLKIAIKLSEIIGGLHQNNIIHKDINPKNIILNPGSAEIQIIDFGIANQLSKENPQIPSPDLIEGTLAYISPEQTGRMNRPVDYRTDFYSLGVTFYEMLAGKVPFESEDSMEMMHSHLAKAPEALHELNTDIPKHISDIVMKLLSKEPDGRYQSAHGLKADLKICLSAAGKLEITGFVPGKHDFSGRLEIPEKIYGREEEIRKLMSVFERVAEGNTEMIVISGYSGIGKTSLIDQVRKPITKQNGYFISGKFEQFKRNTPYGAVIQAFRDLIRQVLSESEDRVRKWEETLVKKLGSNGKVITDVIPELELIIGKQPDVSPLPPDQSQNRFNLTFQNFINAFTQKSHPVALFLDDLQWVDFASLRLLQTTIADPDVKYLFIIGAYRDNEVDEVHPLSIALNEIGKTDANVNHISLEPLNYESLNRLISDSFRCEPKKANPLTELIIQKTNGNPFFVRQFLISLYEEELFHLNYTSGEWEYDIEQLWEKNLTDNVVELMANKVGKLPHETQQVVKFASCIGNQFDLNTLALVNENTAEQTVENLSAAINEGLIIRLELDEGKDQFRFIHDQVQQAAYSLIQDDKKPLLNLQIGRLRLRGEAEKLEENLFEIVNHLNIGAGLIYDEEERLQLANLNLAAGRKAKSSIAYQAALDYFNSGICLLTEEDWEFEYDLLFSLHIEAADCNKYLYGDFEKAEQDFQKLLQKAQSTLDKAKIHNLRVVQFSNMNKYSDAVDSGIEGLKLLGVNLQAPEEEKLANMEKAFADIDLLIEQKSRSIKNYPQQTSKYNYLTNLPVTDNSKILMIIKILNNMIGPTYLTGDMILVNLLNTEIVRKSLVYGISAESSHGFALYAVAVGSIRGDYESGLEFGKLAIELSNQFNNISEKAKVQFVFGTFVKLWRMPFEACFINFRKVYQYGTDNGDFNCIVYTVFNDTIFRLLISKKLSSYLEESLKNSKILKKISAFDFLDNHLDAHQYFQKLLLNWALCLQGRTFDKLSLSDENFNEEKYMEVYGNSPHLNTYYYIAKLHIYLTLEEYDKAIEASNNAQKTCGALRGTIWTVLFNFLTGIAIVSAYKKFNDPDKGLYLEKLTNIEKSLSMYAQNCPENFCCWHLLVSAGLENLKGNIGKAKNLYEEAIRYSEDEWKNTMNSALANDLYFRFWRDRGNMEVAGLYLRKAYAVYSEWGALNKVNNMEERYPELLAASVKTFSGTPPQIDRESRTVEFDPESLDLETVIKASQAVSGEIMLDRLIEKLMKLTLDNSGAEKSVLLLENNEEDFRIEAQADANGVKHFNSASQKDFSEALLPLQLINYLKRTKESVVLADAATDNQFSNDPYIIKNKPKSILCIPILNQGLLKGILYLENGQATGAFTPDRIKTVQFLSSQAAISIENAELYREVEELKSRFEMEKIYLQQEIKAEHNFEEIIGNSESLRKVLGSLQQVAPTDSTVLIQGETGTGKELIARAIHNLSLRKGRPLIKVNCTAISAGLVESELFGHEKGSFTGAIQKHIGMFEMADGGTIFLDEVSEMPAETQVKLLRVLQEGEFLRVGGNKPINVDVRVIAATNRNLEEAVEDGSFRLDLFYRLNVFPLSVPPLRERKSDIPILVNFFVTRFAKKMGKEIEGVSQHTMQRLTNYSWPGNIRELQNVIERAVVLTKSSEIKIDESVLGVRTSPETSGIKTLEDSERDHIIRALEQTKWVINGKNGAALLLDMHPSTLRFRMKKLGIKKQ